MTDERSDHDVASLRITRVEARGALDHQIDALEDIDDKAAQTLRLNVLLFGVVLTLASMLASNDATPTIGRMANGLVVIGVVVSAVSMATSTWVYTSTSYSAGTGPSDLRAFLSKKPSKDEWLTTLLYSYAAWMERNARLNRRDGLVQFVSHVCLFLSIVYYVVGVAFGLFFPEVAWWLPIVATTGFIVSVGVLLLAVRRRLGLKFGEATE